MNRLLIKARSIGRQLGLQRIYYRFMSHRDYEQKFHEAILAELKAGDIAWDIGANQGYYARIFCEKTGAGGQVFAFEPTPDSYAELCRSTAEFPWIRNEMMAMGDFDGATQMVVGEAHRRNQLQWRPEEPSEGNCVQVQVISGDSYRTASGNTPNVIKIDVEGFEEEVLTGMSLLLAAPELRAVFVEVHFRLLEDRGRADAPVRIEKLLRGKGLRPRWVDPSHIAAERISS